MHCFVRSKRVKTISNSTYFRLPNIYINRFYYYFTYKLSDRCAPIIGLGINCFHLKRPLIIFLMSVKDRKIRFRLTRTGKRCPPPDVLACRTVFTISSNKAICYTIKNFWVSLVVQPETNNLITFFFCIVQIPCVYNIFNGIDVFLPFTKTAGTCRPSRRVLTLNRINKKNAHNTSA